MRRIEFRGKRLDTGEWIYGAYIPDYTLDNPNEACWIADKEYGIHYAVDPETVGQLVETNEGKFYEGDIVRIEVSHDKRITDVVRYDNGCFKIGNHPISTPYKLINIWDMEQIEKGGCNGTK